MRSTVFGPMVFVLFLLGSSVGTIVWSLPPDRDRDRDRNGGREVERADRQRDRSDSRRDYRGDSRVANPQLLPPDSGRASHWFLGVAVEYRDIGAQITYVERQSPAQRAGLEVRDIIVTVQGYQVGRIDNRLYPLDRELELRADRHGHVLLLVQNHRNGQLTPLPVRLEPAQRRHDPVTSEPLIGTVTAPRATSLGRGAVLTVRLLDVTDRRLPARTIAERSYREPGPFPIPFELVYDTQRIEAGRRYALEAEITVDGLARLRTAARYPVLQTRRQGRVNLVLSPVRR